MIDRKFQLQVRHNIQINRDSSLMVHLIILRILVTLETDIWVFHNLEFFWDNCSSSSGYDKLSHQILIPLGIILLMNL